MDEHPEQALIEIIMMGDLAGVDEDNYKQVSDAHKQLSEDGKKELERQRKEVHAELDEQEKRSEHLLYLMNPNSTRH